MPAALVWGTAVAYLLCLPPTLNPTDESRFLYGAKRVWMGQAIYHDFFEFFAPGGFYLVALVYALAGPSLQAARAAMVAVNAASAALVYALSRRVAGPLAAVLAAVAFTVECVPVWNAASPHWVGTCLCLGTATVVLSARWETSARLRPAVAGALGGLAFATLQHRGVLLAPWLLFAVLVLPGVAARRRRALASATAGRVVAVGAVLGPTVWRSSLGEVGSATFTHVVSAYAGAFVGKASWGRGVGGEYALPWLRETIVVILAVGVVSLAVRRSWTRSDRPRIVLLALAVSMILATLYFPDLVHRLDRPTGVL